MMDRVADNREALQLLEDIFLNGDISTSAVSKWRKELRARPDCDVRQLLEDLFLNGVMSTTKYSKWVKELKLRKVASLIGGTAMDKIGMIADKVAKELMGAKGKVPYSGNSLGGWVTGKCLS